MKKSNAHLNELKKAEKAIITSEKEIIATRTKSRLRKTAVSAGYIATGVAIGAAAGVATVMLAPVATIGYATYLIAGTAVSAGAITAGADYQISKGKLSKLIENNFELLGLKISLIKEAEGKDNFHFEFNRKSELYPEEVKYQDKDLKGENIKTKKRAEDSFKPIAMTPSILKSLKTALRTQSRNSIENRLSLKTIDISDANLSEKQLKELLAAGLGNFNTETLILNNNNLTNRAIAALRKCIVIDRKSFQDLKRLELRGNNFNDEVLNDIAEIVQCLDLEHLDISNNNLCELHPEEDRTKAVMNINDFLSKQHILIPSLRSIKLRNIGLKDLQAESLWDFISALSMLESVDLRENNDLAETIMEDSSCDRNILNMNISLTEFKSDFSDPDLLDEVIENHYVLFDKLEYRKESGSRITFILNRIMNEQSIPESVASLLSDNPVAMINRLKGFVAKILATRKRILDIPENRRIPITDMEFISAQTNLLPHFYTAILVGEYIDTVHPDLIQKKDTATRPAVLHAFRPAEKQTTPATQVLQPESTASSEISVRATA